MGFCQPNDITVEISEPDILMIVVKLPALIIDSEDYMTLDEDEVVYEVPLVPQKSKSQLEDLTEVAEKALTVVTVLALWQIILFFALGKALKSMWPLLNTA